MQEYDGTVCPHCGYPQHKPNDAHQLPVGSVIRNRYQIGKTLGQGGFGITYLAWDNLMQNIVAVKEFFPSGTVFRRSASSTTVECVTTEMVPHFNYSKQRFLREASALVKFKDIPAVVDIIDFLEENNTAYIVMEYVSGMELTKYVQTRGGKLSVEETFQILKPVMEALAAVHKAAIIHRDISPDNIMLDGEGNVKLLDFGAVRLVENPDIEKSINTSTEAIIKHGFAPLEQYNTRGNLGPWTDEYALCATAWFCMTGKVPEEVPLRMAEGIDPNWSVIPGLTQPQQEALQKGFSCRAKDRYPNMETFIDALFTKDTHSVSKRLTAPIIAIIAVALIVASVGALILSPEVRYKSGLRQMNNGQYEQAFYTFDGLGNYKDSIDLTFQCNYYWGQSLQTAEQYEQAISKYYESEDFLESTDQILKCYYLWGKSLLTEGHYEDAISRFRKSGYYADSDDLILECEYCIANNLLTEGQYLQAIDGFTALENYRNSTQMILTCQYQWANALQAAGDFPQAAMMFAQIMPYEDSRQRSISLWNQIADRDSIGAGYGQTIGLIKDGTVVATGSNFYGELNVSTWQDIIAVSAGFHHSVGLKSDGTVLATGYNQYSQCDVTSWKNVVAICAGYNHTVGLLADGTVVATGMNDRGQCDVSEWTDIIAIGAGRYHTVGLRRDGTVVTIGENTEGCCETTDWTDIIQIEVGDTHSVGLKSDGTVVTAGKNSSGKCNVGSWTNIVGINAGTYHTLGLLADGTLKLTGHNGDARCNVTSWTDIVAVSAGPYHIVGLKADGTLVAVGNTGNGRCDVTGWSNILVPSR